MKGLLMKQEYALDLLNGRKSFDARAYPTNYRGTVAITQSHANLVYGFIDIVNCVPITYEEYLEWHGINANEWYYVRRKLGITDKLPQAYAYIMENPVLLEKPLILNKKINQGTWFNYEKGELVTEINKEPEKEEYNLFNFEDFK